MADLSISPDSAIEFFVCRQQPRSVTVVKFYSWTSSLQIIALSF